MVGDTHRGGKKERMNIGNILHRLYGENTGRRRKVEGDGSVEKVTGVLGSTVRVANFSFTVLIQY